MKTASITRLAILLLLVLSACSRQTPPTTPAVQTPTAAPGVITPENADRLVQIEQLGMGYAMGSPRFSADGTRLYQTTSTGVFVFDTAAYGSGRLVTPFAGFTFDDRMMDVSPDGKTLAIGNDVVSTDSGAHLPALDGKWTDTWAVKFSPDGSTIARGFETAQASVRNHVEIWSLGDGGLQKSFDVLGQGALDFSADGQLLSIQTIFMRKATFVIYDVSSGEELTQWTGERSAFLPGNQLMEEADGTIRIFDLGTGKPVHAFYGTFAGVSPDGKLIGLLSFGQFKIYRIADEVLAATLNVEPAGNAAPIVRFTPDGQIAAVYTADYCCGGHSDFMSLWRVTDGTLIKKVDKASEFFSLSPDGRDLAVTNSVGATQIINPSDGSPAASAGAYNLEASGVAFLPDGHHLVVAAAEDNIGHSPYTFPSGYQPRLLFYDVDSRGLYQTQPAMERDAPLGFSTDGKVYAPADLRALVVPVSALCMRSVAISPDRKKVAEGGCNGLFLWDLITNTLLFHTNDLPGEIISLGFSPDGGRLALAFTSGIMDDPVPDIQVWSAIPDGQLILDLRTVREVNMVTYSPDGRFIAAGGNGGVVIWNASDGFIQVSINERVLGYEPLGVPGIQSLSFSPDGRILALGSVEGMLELWDSATGKQLLAVKGTGGTIYDVDFSPDGRLLAVGFNDGGVWIYGIKP